MASLQQLTFNIFNLANGGQTNRAHNYSERQVHFWIRQYRNFLVSADAGKKGYVDQAFLQSVNCKQLTKVDAALCSANCWGENVYEVCMPELLDLPNNMGIEYFGLVDGQTRLTVSEYNYGGYTKFNRFVPVKPYAQRVGQKFYLFNIDDFWPLEAVTLRGVMADPANLKACGVELACFDIDNDVYPIPPRLETVLMDMILQKEFGVARSVKADKTDDDTTSETF